MSALINPFELNPTGLPQLTIWYWYCAWMRTIYQAETATQWQGWMDTLCEIIGADSGDMIIHNQFNVWFGDNIPRIEIIVAPGGRLVQVRGTTPGGQLFQELLRSGLVSQSPWTGRIVDYFRDRAIDEWNRISGDVDGHAWISVGHSLGGAVAGLLSIHGASSVFTAGQPREGNRAYANSRDSDIKIRLFNTDDPTPRVPPNTLGAIPGVSPTADWIWGNLVDPLSFAPVGDYRHWGRGWSMYPGGLMSASNRDFSMQIDSVGYIVDAVSQGETDRQHYGAEYCKRVRNNIPLPFPLGTPVPSWPGVYEIDQIMYSLNTIEAEFIIPWAGRTLVDEIFALIDRPFLPEFGIPAFQWPIANTGDVIPFECTRRVAND